MKTRPSNKHAPGLIARSVANPRYSVCDSARLSDLDWSNWWTDTSFGGHYLHVVHKDGATAHRVYARGCKTPRIEMNNGNLMWIYRKE